MLAGAECEYSHTCPALVAPANGFVNCPGSAPGAQATYSLRLVEGNLARSAETRTQCLVGCRAGYSAVGVTAPRFCTATGWSDTSAVRCAASQQCSASNNPCLNGATCTANVNGGYRCRCPVGWAGTNCDEADSCVNSLTQLPVPSLCQHGGHCRNIIRGSYGCVCQHGFAGLHCAYANPCAANPCQHGGRCTPGNQSPRGQRALPHRCKCPSGFGGPSCATKFSPARLAACASKPCLNHGNCLVLFNRTMCTCPPGFGGDRCQFHDTKNDCNPNPCKNRGVCHDLHNKFECVCPPNFHGPTCQEKDEIDDCACGTEADRAASGQCGAAPTSVGLREPTPCLNGGQCEDKFHAFACKCTAGFGGDRCQLASRTNVCASHPCQNGAACTLAFNGYTCACTKGWSGLQCATQDTTDDCAGNSCCNGVCRDSLDSYKCSCLPGWYGVDCSGRDTGNFRPSSCSRSSTTAPSAAAVAAAAKKKAAASAGGHSIFGWVLRIAAVGVALCLLRWLRGLLFRAVPKEPLPDFDEGLSESKPLLGVDEED